VEASASPTKPNERSENDEKQVDIGINNFTFINITGTGGR
jgi:hypothetical protein